MPKKKLFIVNWIRPVEIGTSFVMAENIEEATKKANNGEDQDFMEDNMDYNAEWEIRNIREGTEEETKEFLTEEE